MSLQGAPPNRHSRCERTIKTRIYTSNGQKFDRQELFNGETLARSHKLSKLGQPGFTYGSSTARKSPLPEYPLTYKDETLIERTGLYHT